MQAFTWRVCILGVGDVLQANIDPDFPGSCGRCYLVRCHPGLVIANGTTLLNIQNIFYQPAVNSTVQDTYGRQFPGNSAESNQELVRRHAFLSSHIGARALALLRSGSNVNATLDTYIIVH